MKIACMFTGSVLGTWENLNKLKDISIWEPRAGQIHTSLQNCDCLQFIVGFLEREFGNIWIFGLQLCHVSCGVFGKIDILSRERSYACHISSFSISRQYTSVLPVLPISPCPTCWTYFLDVNLFFFGPFRFPHYSFIQTSCTKIALYFALFK